MQLRTLAYVPCAYGIGQEAVACHIYFLSNPFIGSFRHGIALNASFLQMDFALAVFLFPLKE